MKFNTHMPVSLFIFIQVCFKKKSQLANQRRMTVICP
uniref:Uncharacterized protein n=1 Tax=Anguilla anguilla TaxID=7936 RepID=A0A0E9SMF6_ANGAN